jgi:hypothetical protein
MVISTFRTLPTSARNLSLVVFFAVATLAVNREVFETLWRSHHIAGYDGTSHAVVGEYYAKHIFPKTWGWMPHWFAGMPFPQFYPPLFYFLAAVLYHLLPFSYGTIIKGLLTVLTALLPGLSCWVTWTHTRNISAALSTGCLTLVALSYEAPASGFGIAISATFRSGLFTQLLGFVCLLLWCQFFLQVEESKTARYLSVLFLFLTVLSNVHVVPIVALFFLVTLMYRSVGMLRHGRQVQYRKCVCTYTLLGLLPLAGAGLWYIPLWAYFEYLTTMALPSMHLAAFLKMSMAPVVLTCLAVGLSTWRRDISMQIIAIVCILTVFAGTIESAGLLPALPLQPFRFLASFYFLSCIPAGYVFGCMVGWFSIRPMRLLAWMLLMTPFLWYLQAHKAEPFGHFGWYFDHAGDRLQRFLAQLPQGTGLSNVEVHTPSGEPSHFALNAWLARDGFDTTYSVFRESSISSIFMTPLRNSLSKAKEAWGIDTFLAYDPDFLSQDFNRHLDRAAYMGVSHLWVVSPDMVETLSKNPRVRLAHTFGSWHLFQLKDTPMRAQVLHNEPAVFFGSVTFKKRSTWDYDYVRFQEELFFRGVFETLLVRASNMMLDASEDLNRFRTAIITEYRYRDLDRAYARLKQYSGDNVLVCIASDDALFKRLSTLRDSHRIYIFDRLQGDREDLRPLRHQLQSLLDVVFDHKTPVRGYAGQVISDVRFTNESIEVSLTKHAREKIPILIKSSYFPAWRRVDSEEPVYMVTPTFILTYADDDFALTLATGQPVLVGLLISILTAVGIVGEITLTVIAALGKRSRGN